MVSYTSSRNAQRCGGGLTRLLCALALLAAMASCSWALAVPTESGSPVQPLPLADAENSWDLGLAPPPPAVASLERPLRF
eukprot:m.48140 g.48140  ORF g.48140 m.48140 type:complete len:80 (-) comp14927_c0_seq1:41-280(-)